MWVFYVYGIGYWRVFRNSYLKFGYKRFSEKKYMGEKRERKIREGGGKKGELGKKLICAHTCARIYIYLGVCIGKGLEDMI